jgi:hypothetical protein
VKYSERVYGPERLLTPGDDVGDGVGDATGVEVGVAGVAAAGGGDTG